MKSRQAMKILKRIMLGGGPVLVRYLSRGRYARALARVGTERSAEFRRLLTEIEVAISSPPITSEELRRGLLRRLAMSGAEYPRAAADLAEVFMREAEELTDRKLPRPLIDWDPIRRDVIRVRWPILVPEKMAYRVPSGPEWLIRKNPCAA